MDVTQAMKDAENSLRDFITEVLHGAIGQHWEQKCGVTDDRLQKWKERREEERKRQESSTADERLIYYADFYDLRTILQKNWSYFAAALGNLKTMEVLLSELEKLRDPDAHRRELMPHQKNLALGISGEIRSRIIRFRSKQEAASDYFPRIECARDSLGNACTPHHSPSKSAAETVLTGCNLRPGDTLSFVVTAFDPLGQQLLYEVEIDHNPYLEWQSRPEFEVTFGQEHIKLGLHVSISMKSNRKYHAMGYCDDFVDFVYTVLPLRQQEEQAGGRNVRHGSDSP